jgi:hypothetical protein
MVFALERTNSALSLLALEKTTAGYRITHYDKRPLNQTPHRQISSVQEMFNALPQPASNLTVGIHDNDVIIRHIQIDAALSTLKTYQHCKEKLAQELVLKEYSWDAYPLTHYEGKGHSLLCVAYPLEKIIFLQTLLKLCNLRMHVLEPSICALARMSFILLKLPRALFLLHENNLFTLIRVIQGEISSIRQMQNLENLEENVILINTDLKTSINIPHQKYIDLSPYIQNANQYGLQIESTPLFSPLGLALRSCAA